MTGFLRGARRGAMVVACAVLWLAGCSDDGGTATPGADTGPPPADTVEGDVATDTVADAGESVVLESYRERLGGAITNRVRFVVDQSLEGEIDEARLTAYVTGQTLHEAYDYTTLALPENWWEDYQDFADFLYYSADHVFGNDSPYPGARFMPYVWNDVTYGVREATVEYLDLSPFYVAVESRKIMREDPTGKTWALLSANEGMAWVTAQFPHEPDEMVVVVTNNTAYATEAQSYYFVEEEYGAERGWTTHYYNTLFNEWPTAMQTAEELEPHDLPIWMHFAFLNGEWDADNERWALFPNRRWGGYDGANVYVIDFATELLVEQDDCDPVPTRPRTHAYLDEQAFRRCFDLTERLEYDWYRLWRHAFHVPSFPFWWSEKVDVRVVVVDLRGYDGDTPEYAADDVIDWQTVEDSIRAANPFADLTIQRYDWRPSAEEIAVLESHFIQEADYPLHVAVNVPRADGSFAGATMDWHYHFDIPGLPGLQVYLTDKLRSYFGGVEGNEPVQYDPFAEPYLKTGEPFVVPAIFFLTPFEAYDGQVGGWTANTGQLMCIFAKQFGVSCEQIMQMMQDSFGRPIGPNLNAWSNAYGLWWEVFILDFTYATSPIQTLRFLLDPEPFEDLVEAIPDFGAGLALIAPKLFDQIFGAFHPWSSGFPVWFRESLDDPEIRELTRQYTSYQFAETIQHNIGYKHQTTVVFDAPYLGMEDGFDYREHRDLDETFDMTVEQATMPFYSTEPGSRDFPIDANTYMTHKMGAGTQHMLQRIFARREIMALWEELDAIDAATKLDDEDVRAAALAYTRASDHALAWRHAEAYQQALLGLEALDRYFTGQGEPDRLHTDWDAPVSFTPATTGLSVTVEQLDNDLTRLEGAE